MKCFFLVVVAFIIPFVKGFATNQNTVFLKKELDMENHIIKNVGAPFASDHATNKEYVDASSPDSCCSPIHAASSSLECVALVIAPNNVTCFVYARTSGLTRATYSPEEIQLFKAKTSGAAVVVPGVYPALSYDMMEQVYLLSIPTMKTGELNVQVDYFGLLVGNAVVNVQSGPPHSSFSYVASCNDPVFSPSYTMVCQVYVRSVIDLDITYDELVNVYAVQLTAEASLSDVGSVSSISFDVISTGRVDVTLIWATPSMVNSVLSLNVSFAGNEFPSFSHLVDFVEPTCAEWSAGFPTTLAGWNAIDLAAEDYPDGTSASVTFTSSGSTHQNGNANFLDDHFGLTSGALYNEHCIYRIYGPPYTYVADFGAPITLKGFAASGYAGDSGGNYEPANSANSWALEGSDDASSWTELWSGSETDYFSGGRPEAYLSYPMPTAYVHCLDVGQTYRYFRIKITAEESATYGVIMCNWAFFPVII